MSLLLLLLAVAASAAVPFELPPDEPALAWSGPLDLADFERRAVEDDVGVVVTAEEGSWKLTVRDDAGTVRVAWVDPPQTPEAREQLVWLADSLVRPVAGLSLRIGLRESAVPAAPVQAPVPAPLAPPVHLAASPAPDADVAAVPEEVAAPDAVLDAAVDALEEAALDGSDGVALAAPVEQPRAAVTPPPSEEELALLPPLLGEGFDDPLRPRKPAFSPTLAVGAALRSRVAPALSARLGLERIAPKWTAGAEVHFELPAAMPKLEPDSSLRAWGFDASVGAVAGGFRTELLAGVALATFREEDEAPQRLALPRLAARVGTDIPVGRMVLRPRIALERELIPVQLVVDGRPLGRMSPWTVSGDLVVALPPRRPSE